ncbi:pLS20_p028 family conjugation system transmembrane protein [Enterococcus rivorum]
MVDFIESDQLKSFVEDNRVAIFSIGAVCILLFCISYMQNSKKTSMKSLLNNILLGVGVIVVGLTLTYTLTNGAFKVAKSIYGEDSTTADQIIKANIYDVTTFDSFNWESTKKVKSIDYDATSLRLMDITAEVKPKEIKSDNPITKEIFNKKVFITIDGEATVVPLDRGMFKMDESYYRYSWHPWIIVFQLITTGIVLLAASFKYTKCIYNSAYNGMIAPFFSFSDLIESSKVMKVITGIVNTSINIVMFAVSLKLYRMLSAYTGTIDINKIQQIFIQFFLALIVVEGPYIIQEITGQDGGVRSEAKAIGASAIGAAFAGKKLGKGLKNSFDSAKDKIKKGANFAAGIGAGAMDHFGKDTLEDEMTAEKNNDNQPTNATADPNKEMSDQERESFNQSVKDELQGTEGDSLSNKSADSEDSSNLNQDGIDSVDPGQGLTAPKPPSGLEGISATAPLLEKEMEEATENGSIPGVSAIGSQSAIPQGAMAKASPLSQEIGAAMNSMATTRGNSVGMASQAAIQTALSSPSGSTNGMSAQMPEAIKAMSGFQELKQGGFMAPLSNPSSARLAKILSVPAMAPISQMPTSFTQQAIGGGGFTGSIAPTMLNASVPAAIQSLPGVQQFKQDLANSGQPLTKDTLSDVISNKWADRQIKKAEERKVYQSYKQLGKNTSKKALEDFVPRKDREGN